MSCLSLCCTFLCRTTSSENCPDFHGRCLEFVFYTFCVTSLYVASCFFGRRKKQSSEESGLKYRRSYRADLITSLTQRCLSVYCSSKCLNEAVCLLVTWRTTALFNVQPLRGHRSSEMIRWTSMKSVSSSRFSLGHLRHPDFSFLQKF